MVASLNWTLHQQMKMEMTIYVDDHEDDDDNCDNDDGGDGHAYI